MSVKTLLVASLLAKFEESLQNEKALVGLLSGELDAAKMQLASAKNQTCSSKNVTTDVSSCLNDLDLDEEIERLTSEKRQIVAFILQVFKNNECFY